MKTLADILASPNPGNALVGVPLATLRAWAAQLPAVAATPVAPIVAFVSPGIAA
ncbi:hypothetical protein F4693_000151 [Sphingomonas endophytica]|uniref:Uncharacterized protein n=1 Tax=Sphingomonas endophytica TaxID=869719 RepID=A0A7X0JAV5_9SPHN|nr:hypothetical protein [Sphingomonas endophytica]MBB6503202.1 hypothetical protein [Sphingomonas endophytica]